MPIGSKFSIAHTMMQLSLQSLITSISNSFQPISDSSINNSSVGDRSNPLRHIIPNSSRLYAMPPPEPPIVNDGLIIHGNPNLSAIWFASSKLCATPELGVVRPIFRIAISNLSRSSALSIALAFAPIISTLYLIKIPCFDKSNAQFRAVCPPIVGRRASGRSFSIILATVCQCTGSM